MTLAPVPDIQNVPPQNQEAEEAVLGALMLVAPDSPVFDAVLEIGLRATTSTSTRTG